MSLVSVLVGGHLTSASFTLHSHYYVNNCQKELPSKFVQDKDGKRERERDTEFHCVIYVTGDEQRSIHFDLVINCYQIMSLLINREK